LLLLSWLQEVRVDTFMRVDKIFFIIPAEKERASPGQNAADSPPVAPTESDRRFLAWLSRQSGDAGTMRRLHLSHMNER
jgi:hypothetical protein